jgi:hypothetical protein
VLVDLYQIDFNFFIKINSRPAYGMFFLFSILVGFVEATLDAAQNPLFRDFVFLFGQSAGTKRRRRRAHSAVTETCSHFL